MNDNEIPAMARIAGMTRQPIFVFTKEILIES